MSRRALPLLLLACLVLPLPARAGTLMAQWENDIWGGTDRHYTNAVRLLWLSDDLKSYAADDRLPPGFRDWLATLPLINQEHKKFNVGLAFGQEMYTPGDISLTDPPQDDRPYAGWLYGSLILDQKSDTWLDTVELTFGMVGPSSHAEETQRAVHEAIDSTIPQGWGTQLKDEPGLMLSYQGTWRAFETDLVDSIGLDVMPHFGGTAGNVKTFANAGGEVRFGWNLPKNFGTTLIGPGGGVGIADLAADGAPPPDASPYAAYGFCYLDGRAVARNIFLDGNTFHQSRRVPKKGLVADIALGVAMHVHDFFVSYTHVYRTPEYSGDDGQEFGSVTIGYHF